MTIDFEQGDQQMVDASAMAEKLAALGSMEAVKESGAFDELMAQIDAGEIQLDGKDGFIQQIIRAGLERGLQAELTGHLGYDKHSAEGRGTDNSTNEHLPEDRVHGGR